MKSKKLPKALLDELKHHDMAINIVVRYDYKYKLKTANQLVHELKKIRALKNKKQEIE